MLGRACFWAAVSGLLLALSYPSLGWDWLAWVALVPLLLYLPARGLGQAAGLGFLHGVVFFAVTLAWLYHFFRTYGELSRIGAYGLLALMVGILALYPAAFAVCVHLVGRRSPLHALAAAGFLWVGWELLRARLPVLGFPWNLLGYAVAGRLAVAQLAAWTGVYGLSFLVVAYNAWLAAAWRLRQRKGVWRVTVVLSGLLAVVLIGGERLVPTPRPAHWAQLVQLNFVPQLRYPADWYEQHRADLRQIVALSASSGAEWVIWPEVPAPFTLGDPRFDRLAESVVTQAQRPLLAGADRWLRGSDGVPHAYNSAFLMAPSGWIEFEYAKLHLVPFGEYVPWRRYLSFARPLVASIGDYTPGSQRTVGWLDGHRFAVFICYEAIFPHEVRQFTRAGAELLVNISDDGWYGTSAALAQHLHMARLRAVENRRWLLRDTNTGVTAVIDPYGRIRQRLPVGQRAALTAGFDYRSDLTPYARWGDWWAWLCVGVGGIWLLVSRMGNSRPASLS